MMSVDDRRLIDSPIRWSRSSLRGRRSPLRRPVTFLEGCRLGGC
jgi:hypothetical protein